VLERERERERDVFRCCRDKMAKTTSELMLYREEGSCSKSFRQGCHRQMKNELHIICFVFLMRLHWEDLKLRQLSGGNLINVLVGTIHKYYLDKIRHDATKRQNSTFLVCNLQSCHLKRASKYALTLALCI
jgi:hypothetical protein